MKVLELLQGFNTEQEKQNKIIHNKFKEQKHEIWKIAKEVETKCNLFKAYASFDEVSDKMAKMQNSMHA